MFGLGRKAALITAASVLGVGLLGSAALAAFAPVSGAAAVQVADAASATDVSEAPRPGALKTILDGLVTKGTITQAQEDAILAAVRDAVAQRKARHPALKSVLGDLMRTAVDYIGLPKEAVAGQLRAGKSLGQIADQQPGKSRDGLVAAVTAEANAKIDAAVTAGKITPEQAAQLKAKVPAAVERLVDATHDRRAPRGGNGG